MPRYRITWLGLGVISTALVATLTHLLLFHVMLMCMGTSTYDHIMAARARKAADPTGPRAPPIRGPLGAWLLPTPRNHKVAPHDVAGQLERAATPGPSSEGNLQGLGVGQTTAGKHRDARDGRALDTKGSSEFSDPPQGLVRDGSRDSATVSGGVTPAGGQGLGGTTEMVEGSPSRRTNRGSLPRGRGAVGQSLTPRMSAKVAPMGLTKSLGENGQN